MENYKVFVNNWDESKEVQELFIELGATGSVRQITSKWVCSYYKQITFYDLLPNVDFEEITLQQLRDLVVLKRNDVNDANYESENGDRKYYLTTYEFFEFINGVWVNIDEFVDGMSFKPIYKDGEVKMKKKEFLNPEQGYALVECFVGKTSIPESWVEVPEGAEDYRINHRFYKNSGKMFYATYGGWEKSNYTNFDVLWQRNKTNITIDTSTQDKLKFIEKWLNGEKIQYILGVESEKTQADESKWHNFTEGAMRYIKRSDIKFREAPKYVTINGIEFKSVESLLKYVKNNFDLEDGE